MSTAAKPTKQDIQNKLTTYMAQGLGVPAASIDPSARFLVSGGNSILFMQMMSRLENDLGIAVNVESAARFDTIADLSAHLATQV
ncbi:acyl carrier protein [Inquilinus sp. Marseille-Q2685]|uniref:acyl carrier protein n=1 Tax=Inquilinus sp. Marseille-Q2685 TaxID=2866581 RepID=UPI001CE3FF02|nr:acyl carrier protein [Inquilinus sp. Marseille-Q2685]